MSGRKRKLNRKEKQNEIQQSLDIMLRELLAGNEVENLPQNEADENEETETQDDGMGIVETYAEYWPSKLKIGLKHPDPVVCTASLASVESADITYSLKIPEKVIDKGSLSALQLEAVAYASQAHERFLADKNRSRVGFLIGTFKG